MKQVDKTVIYNLEGITQEQRKELTSITDIKAIRNTMFNFLWFDGCWIISTANNTKRTVVNALELFKNKAVDVVMYDIAHNNKNNNNTLELVEVSNDFKRITDSVASLLEFKNKKYGNSALDPLNIFSGKCKVGQRLDDKLARVKNNDTLQKNDVADLIGYLVLVCKENNWTNFDEFKD